MVDLLKLLHGSLDDKARSWLDAALGEIGADPGRLPVLFPQLPRRLGRQALSGGGPVREGDLTVDLDAWRRCDAGAWTLVSAAGGDPGESIGRLYEHGDMEERTMALRCLALLPVTAATAALLGEVQRTNMVVHVEAGVCDSNLLARAVGQADFGIDDFNRSILKLAFIDLPLLRAYDAEQHANAELSRMLQGLATEREAAGRPVWRDTNRLTARAPTDGTVARLIGSLEHGDDGQRLAAAEGIAWLDRDDVREFARARLSREQRAEIRSALERALET